MRAEKIDPASILVRVDGSIVPPGAISLGDYSIDYTHHSRFEPLSWHSIDVWYETIDPRNSVHQRELARVPQYTVIPGDRTRIVTMEPKGFTTNHQTVRISFSKATSNPSSGRKDFALAVNGLPTGFNFSETPTTIELTAELPALCPGEYNLNVGWREPSDGTLYQEKFTFEYTGPLASIASNQGGIYEASLLPGEYYCYLTTTEAGAAAAITLELFLGSTDTNRVELGSFTAEAGFRPLRDANGDRAIIFLSDSRRLRINDPSSEPTLHFQPISNACADRLRIENSPEGLTLHRGGGRIQFSRDLFDWEEAGPLFTPRFEKTGGKLFFRERR